MNKQQQIEELAGTICNACKERFEISKKCKNVIEPCLAAYAHAEALYNAGYRKIPEDSVVLSREVYDEIRTYQSYIPEMKKAFDKIRNAIIKETAEKIFKMLISELESNKFLYGKRIIMEADVENLAKQFGVEEK